MSEDSAAKGSAKDGFAAAKGSAVAEDSAASGSAAAEGSAAEGAGGTGVAEGAAPSKRPSARSEKPSTEVTGAASERAPKSSRAPKSMKLAPARLRPSLGISGRTN